MNRLALCALLSYVTYSPGANGQTGTISQSLGPSSGEKAQLAETFGKLPLSFEANSGQADPSVKFFSRVGGYGLYLTDKEVLLALHKDGCVAPPDPKRSEADCPHQPSLLRMSLTGASGRAAPPAGEGRLPGTANYFIGNDPAKWQTSVPTYARVRYRGVYPGVDLVYYGNQRQLEYDFVVAPGADPKLIRLRFGAEKGLRLDADGNLAVTAADGVMSLHKPVVYQLENGQRKAVESGFALLARHTVGFRLGSYDRGKPLVIDPVLVYSTYLGGNSSYSDGINGIVVDSAGNVYAVGSADSADFPVTTGAYQRVNRAAANRNSNAFVTKLNPTGTALVYSTYLGGSASINGTGDGASAVALDSSGNTYIVGETVSGDFPVTNGAFQTTTKPGFLTGFVAKLNPTGSALVYSTYLGGSGDKATAVAVDGSGNAYITGDAGSTNFPVTQGALQPTNMAAKNLSTNAFVTKLNPTGTALVYSTYLGGSGSTIFGYGDVANALALDVGGNAYIAGYAYSPDFPVTAGSFQISNRAAFSFGNNAFVSKLNPAGTALVYSTYLGGSGVLKSGDAANGLAVDSSGSAYVTGSALSGDFPVTPGAFQATYRAVAYGPNAFVTKLNPTGTALAYSTYLGGSGIYENGDTAKAVAVDGSGNAYITGSATSTDFPLTQGAIQTTNQAAARSGTNAFVTMINPAGTALLYSSYLGGSGGFTGGGDIALAVAVDSSGSAYIAGMSNSTNFPLTPGAFQTTNHSTNRGFDGFVAKLALNAASPPPSPPPSITPGGIVPVDGATSTIQPGEWVSIYGTNLASSTMNWNGDFPTSLGGTSVTIDGKAAYLSFVSSGQINLQVPNDTITGSVSVAVTTAGGTATSTVMLAPFAPSLLLLDSKHVAGIILRSNGSGANGGGTYDIIGPTGSSLGYPTVAAKAGDVVELFGTGFGPTNPAVPAGQAFSGSAPTTNAVTLRINNVSVTPAFAGLTGAGLYQINLTVPAGLGTGDAPLVATVAAAQTPSSVVISLQ